jgi:hypothetical protein
MIAIDRAGRSSSLKKMFREAREATAQGRSLLIFPEGTRRAPTERADFHRGVLLLYKAIGVPVVPVAHNAGLYWKARSFTITGGEITVSYLPAIPPGLPDEEFMTRLRDSQSMPSATAWSVRQEPWWRTRRERWHCDHWRRTGRLPARRLAARSGLCGDDHAGRRGAGIAPISARRCPRRISRARPMPKLLELRPAAFLCRPSHRPRHRAGRDNRPRCPARDAVGRLEPHL